MAYHIIRLYWNNSEVLLQSRLVVKADSRIELSSLIPSLKDIQEDLITHHEDDPAFYYEFSLEREQPNGEEVPLFRFKTIQNLRDRVLRWSQYGHDLKWSDDFGYSDEEYDEYYGY